MIHQIEDVEITLASYTAAWMVHRETLLAAIMEGDAFKALLHKNLKKAVARSWDPPRPQVEWFR